MGYLFVLGFVIVEVGEQFIAPSEAANATLLSTFVWLGGLGYWLICIYRFHVVLAKATNGSYPITPARAAWFNLIPFYGLYWIFKWTNEVARFVNARAGARRMPIGWTGVFVLLGPPLARIDAAIALAVLFAVGAYIKYQIVRALAHEPVAAQ